MTTVLPREALCENATQTIRKRSAVVWMIFFILII